MYMHVYLLVYFLAMPTQAFLVNPVGWLHVTEDLATVCLCHIEIMMVSLLVSLYFKFVAFAP